MKKTYQIPTTKVIRIAVQHLMAGSEPEQLGFGDNVITASGADSREGDSFFDDSDDEW